MKKGRGKAVARFLHSLNPFSKKDILDRYAKFVQQGLKARQEDILKKLNSYYPPDTKFVTLSVDMDYMAAGDAPNNFIKQLEELRELKANSNYKDHLLPFICADPRRPDIKELVQEYIEQHHFTGIKIYPALGYCPNDPRLDDIYQYADDHELPIMTHTTRGGVFYRGDFSEVPPCFKNKEILKKKNKDLTDHFTNPDNYIPILEKYHKLKLCFGHFGGMSEWDKYLNPKKNQNAADSWFVKIKEIIKKYDNVYTDISYTAASHELLPLLYISLQTPKLKDRILFGSDFYMANIEGTEYKFSVNLRSFLGEENYRKMAEENPKRFLFH
ncbi:amidohydrolase family protein [Bacteroidota bacterium]